MAEETSSAFQRKLAQRRAKEAAAKAASEPKAEYADLIPEDPFERSDEDRQLDTAIQNIGILEAYQRWCGKMTPKVHKGQRESIMVSCPKPSHPDKNPSAWINLDKGTWFCGSCQEGGDAHDLAAMYHGYPIPGYKDGKDFHKLRIQMAKDFGYVFETAPGGVSYMVAPEPEPEPEPEPKKSEATGPKPPEPPRVVTPEPMDDPVEETSADVYQMFDDGDLPVYEYPELDWRSITPRDTFMHEYMEATRIDDVAEEFHFFNGLICLGFALGRNARLFDLKPVYGNLFVCTLGHSGTGKSKSTGYAFNLLKDALPHDWSDPSSRGVKKISSPGSAEALINSFMKGITDPSTGKGIMYYAPVSGLIDFNELSSLVGRTNRQGNVLKPTLMQFYDMDDVIETSSMSTGTKEAHEPFASCITSTQPAALRGLIGRADDDSGFLNRWLFVAGPEKKKIAIGGARVDITPAVLPLQRILAWSGTFASDEFVEWGPEAMDKFTEFFHNRLQVDKFRADSALLTRADLLMKKLVLLLSANKLEKVVSGQTVDDAISMYEYIKKCYAMPAQEIGRTLGSEVDDAILYQAKRVLEKENRGVSMSEITRALRRRNYPSEMLVKHIDLLVKLDMLRVETTGPGVGRPTVRYKYVAS